MAILAFHDCSVIAGALLKVIPSISSECQSTCFKYFPRTDVVALSFGSRLLSQALVDYGWRDGLPRPMWNRLKLMVRRRFPRILFSALCVEQIAPFGEGVALLTILSCSMVETSCAIPPRGGITGVMVANLTGHLLPWISSKCLAPLA